MTKQQHTAGPWSRATKGEDNYCHIGQVVDSDHITVAIAHGKNAETEANARLIAAAPELLDELTKAQDSLCRAYCVWSKHDDHAIEHVADCISGRAVLAKARGETSHD